jgi:protoheme IX farnesyltransferase
MGCAMDNVLEGNFKLFANDLWELCKPRVVALMVLTAMVGMALASPGAIPLNLFFYGNIGIALAAGSAAVVNQLIDRHIDAIMLRTQNRPLVQGGVTTTQAIIWAGILAALSMFLLITQVNSLCAILSFLTLIGYAGCYTVLLKRTTPQNIVIGGAAGAAPPLLGWVAISGQLDPQPLLLMLIIFVWTPPHFWALAIHRIDDYRKAGIPMLPVTHGIPFTKLSELIYTLLLFAVTLLPFVIGMASLIYLISSIILNIIFIHYAWRLYTCEDSNIAMATFRYSIIYLMILFTALLVDHWSNLFLS